MFSINYGLVFIDGKHKNVLDSNCFAEGINNQKVKEIHYIPEKGKVEDNYRRIYLENLAKLPFFHLFGVEIAEIDSKGAIVKTLEWPRAYILLLLSLLRYLKEAPLYIHTFNYLIKENIDPLAAMYLSHCLSIKNETLIVGASTCLGHSLMGGEEFTYKDIEQFRNTYENTFLSYPKNTGIRSGEELHRLLCNTRMYNKEKEQTSIYYKYLNSLGVVSIQNIRDLIKAEKEKINASNNTGQ